MAERTTTRRARLDQPAEPRRGLPRPHYDPEAFGRFSERIARFMGTGRFLVFMTVFIAVWIVLNVSPLAWDPYTFTFLTLLLSLQASYAAPLILLAQNRQADRDRISMEEDRAQNARLQADVEYLTREIASMRVALGEVATRDFIRDQLRELTETSADTAGRLERERRAERKKRKREGLRDAEPERPPSLGEPFVGDPDDEVPTGPVGSDGA